MAIDWDSLYELTPSDTTYVKDTDDAIRSLKTATRERLVKEHYFDLSEGSPMPRQGLHRAGSAVAFYQASAPTQRNGVTLAAADAGLLFVDSDDKLLKVWDGDSFEAVASGEAASAAEADTVVVAQVSDNVSYPLALVASAGAGAKAIKSDSSGGTYNPSTNTAAISISGNAATLAGTTPGAGGLAALAKAGTIWAADNDGSGSGLDADLVRGTTPGTRGLAYLAAAAIADMAALVLSDIKTVDGSGSGLDTDLVRGTTPGTGGLNLLALTSALGTGWSTALAAAVGAQARTYLTKDTQAAMAAQLLTDLKTVDGSGSGLDADLFRGLDLTRFIYGTNGRGTEDRSTTDLDLILKSGFYSFAAGATHVPDANNGHLVHIQYASADTAAIQLAFYQAAGGGCWVRRKSIGTWGAWSKLWTGDTDGSGSGMDTDLVRGVTPGTGGLALLALAALGTNWATALGANLGTGWTTALAATVGTGGRDLLALTSALGTGWSTALAVAVGAQARTYLTKDTQATMAAQILADLKTVDGAGSGLVSDDSITVGGYGVTTNDDGIRVHHGYINGSTVTKNAVFDALAPAIPTVGDRIALSGTCVLAGPSVCIITSAYRDSSTEIVLFGTNSSGSHLPIGQVVDGDTTNTLSVNLAW